MSMADRPDSSPTKRAKTLEAQAKEAQQTIEELRARDALKTQFLSNVSHDLRTPLAAIITHAEILREGMLGELNPKQRDSVTGIVSGGQQLIDMVDEILTYVRSASDQVTLVRSEFDITRLVDQVRALNQPLAAKKRLTIERRNGDDLPTVYADRDKVKHVLANLIGNAIKFTPEGGQAWVAFSRRGSDRGWWKSATTAVASHGITTTSCSASSRRSTPHPRVRTMGRAWVSRSRATWSSCTLERSGSRASLAKEADSFLRCRSIRPATKCRRAF